MDVDDWIENRILWKAGKHSLPSGHTHLFTDLPAADRGPFETAAAQSHLGRPILVFSGSPDLWTVLGTRKIMSQHHGRLHVFPLRQLVSVGPRDNPRPWWSNEQIRNWKGSWEYLLLKRTWWRSSTIWVPRGGEAFALWSILRMFPSIYRSVEQKQDAIKL